MRTQETTRQTARPSTSKIWRFNGVAAAVAVALGGLAAVPGEAFAAAPAANPPLVTRHLPPIPMLQQCHVLQHPTRLIPLFNKLAVSP